MLRSIFIGILFISASLTFTSCQKEESTTTNTAADHTHDASHVHYTCTMHPEVEAHEPGKCPKCGMDLVPVNAGKTGDLHDSTLYKVDFETLPAAINPAEPAILKFTPKDARNQSTLKDLSIVHEMPMHLLIVSKDLSFFDHQHPEVKPDGSYELAYKFPRPDDYLFYVDITPNGASHNQVFRLEKQVGSVSPKQPNLVVSDTFTSDGYEYQLSSEPASLQSGKSSTLTIKITKGGKPVTVIGKYLGALGHMVIISEDTKQFLHAHPEDHAHSDAELKNPAAHSHTTQPAMISNSGPNVSFMTLFNKPGKYKVWAQFNIEGKIRTVEFVVSVS